MAQKTFTFTKKTKDVRDTDIMGVTRIKCDKMVFTMRMFQDCIGHDDSLPYFAILYVDNVPTYECFNDGWGGETDIKVLDHAKDEQVAKAIEGKKFYFDGYKKVTIDLKVWHIADFLADTCYCQLHSQDNK